ncbi:MAG: hypothetical protein EOL87_05290 [Spartobacteria bacterium]|nr:hypothetical protein [Spartobacteria bacterium]
MSGTDFFDDDLIQQRDAAKRIKMGPGDMPASESLKHPPQTSSSEMPQRSVGDLNLTRMAQYREEINGRVAQTSEELERLRGRHEQLEREKKELEVLRNRQDDFLTGKRAILERFQQSLMHLENEEVRAERVCEVIAATRARFKELYHQIDELREENWAEEYLHEELTRSLSIIEDARMEFKKGLARVESLTEQSAEKKKDTPGVLFDEHVPAPREQSSAVFSEKAFSFVYWLKVGVAVSLPITLTLIVLSIISWLIKSNLGY